MRRVRRPGRQVLERLPEVRCRVRLVLLLRLLCRLFRLRGIDLQGVRAARLRAQDRHGVVELLGPFATLDAHPAVRAILRVQVLLVPREEHLAVAERTVQGPRLPHDPFCEDGHLAFAEIRGHRPQTKARPVMKVPTRFAADCRGALSPGRISPSGHPQGQMVPALGPSRTCKSCDSSPTMISTGRCSATKRVGPSRRDIGPSTRKRAWPGRARAWSISAIARKSHSRAPNAFRSWMAL